MQNITQGTWTKIKEFAQGFWTEVTGNTASPLEVKPERGRNMKFKAGAINGIVYGGPYMQRPANIVGVKMALEIDRPCDVNIPTRDFDVPNVNVFKTGLALGIMHLKAKGEIYVGCMGGIGRTGLYMAGLAKVMEEMGELDTDGPELSIPHSVAYVRNQYLGHAVETRQQLEYIENLDVSDIVAAVKNF